MSNRTIPIHDGSHGLNAAQQRAHAMAFDSRPSLHACVRENNTVDFAAVARLAVYISQRRGTDFWNEFRRQQVEAEHIATTRRQRAEIEEANARLPLRQQLIASLRLELEKAIHGLAQPLDHDRIARLRHAIAAAEAAS